MDRGIWPFSGGTRREKFMAAAICLELWLLWSGWYLLAWALKQ
jgi:hypothetical protein